MEKIKPAITKTFGQFSVCVCRKKIDHYKTYVTDGKKILSISLFPAKNDIESALKRLEEIKDVSDNLNYFKLMVAGSLMISMKEFPMHN
jgi:hypothetical protein